MPEPSDLARLIDKHAHTEWSTFEGGVSVPAKAKHACDCGWTGTGQWVWHEHLAEVMREAVLTTIRTLCEQWGATGQPSIAVGRAMIRAAIGDPS